MDRISIPGRWIGLAHERLRPGPAVWSVLIAVVSIVPMYRASGPLAVGPFSVYYQTGEWLDQNTTRDEKVLDLTDWSLYLSQRAGYEFADIRHARAVGSTRWVVARRQDVEGPWHYCGVIRELIGGREPVVSVPPDAEPNQIQIQIYDLASPLVRTATTELGGMDCGGSRPTVR